MTASKQKSLDVLIQKIDAIPSLPQVTDRIVELVSKETTTVDDLEQAIRTDPGLSSRILRFANARYYGHEGKVTALDQAIKILGFKTVRSIALTYGMEQQYTAPELSSFPRDQFWVYSLSVGICSEIVAEKLGYSQKRKAEVFSGGHLHAIGKAILDQYLHRDFIRIIQKKQKDDTTMFEAENELLGLTHCQIGAAVLQEWGLPEEIVSCARSYYHPSENDREEVMIVHLASVLVKTKGFGYAGDQAISYLNEPLIDQLNLTDEQVERVIQEELPEKVKPIRNMVL